MDHAVPPADLPERLPAGPSEGLSEDLPADPTQEARQAEPEHDPAAPAPLNVPRTPTGDAGVDAALARLGDADHLATDGHIEVYEDVHRGLRDALTALDVRPGPPAPPSPPSPPGPRS
ncbi:hypothetical protein SUDANB108_01562 [Streptomyces sp. enrichment culture]|uniref:hypothetical protein n=1 Tax=Streptomyces sp. enrichment culture TaxID=1795815 RepID=UPI003F56DF89